MNTDQLKELAEILTKLAPDEMSALVNKLESMAGKKQLVMDFIAAIQESDSYPDECGE